MLGCLWVCATIAVASGCVTSNASQCGDLTCPSGTTCAPSVARCVDTDLVAACRGGGDGQACSVAGMPPATCLGGICQASRCGDLRVSGAEECDANDFDGRTCQTLGFYNKPGLGCTAECRYETTKCVGRCGDGIKNGAEKCDRSDLGTASCFTVGYYSASGLACTADCTFDSTACSGGRCGDGIINGLKEQCDDKKFSTTCREMGFLGARSGQACSASCTLTRQSCLCTAGTRCAAWNEQCECGKFGCGCVAKSP